MTGDREPRGAVFLDRDGTLNRELEQPPAHPDELELLPGALAAAARLHRAGFVLVVVTNQSAVARGRVTQAQLHAVHAALRARCAEAGAPLAGVYACPHHPDDGAPPYRRPCACRKPAPGLLLRAARDLNLDLGASWLVGDAARDLEAARRAGVRPLLVRTGKGAAEEQRLREEGAPPPDTATDLGAAAARVLQGR